MRWSALKLLGLTIATFCTSCLEKPFIDTEHVVVKDAILLGCLDFTENVKAEETIKRQILELQSFNRLKTNFPEELGARTCSIFVLDDYNKATLDFILETLRTDGSEFKPRGGKTFKNGVISNQFIWERDDFNIGLTISNNTGQTNHPVSWIASTYRTKERSDE